jgi:benzylsuccinate CoA-transferase BbsE subunit
MDVLRGYRVLETSDNLAGAIVTKILAYLGAEVIVVEKPGGNPSRNTSPFYHDIPGPENSLQWFFYNLNKKSVTLNIEHPEGNKIFKQLLRNAHVLVECYPPDYLDKLGLGYDAISRLNRNIIMTSITPFGQSGPYAHYKGPSLVVDALSGSMFLRGETKYPPVMPSFPTVEVQSAVRAAMGTLIAHYYKGNTGEGQHIDVSMQEASIVPTYLWLQVKFYGVELERSSAGCRILGAKRMFADNFACKDGYVFAYTTYYEDRRNVRDWLAAEGMADDLLEEKWRPIFEGPGAVLSDMDREHIDSLFAQLCRRYTKAELFKEGQRRRVMVCPINTIKDIVEDEHLNVVEYFTPVYHPELNDTIRYPRIPVRFSEGEFDFRRAPLVGEHNEEIYLKELKFSKEQLKAFMEMGVI